MFNSLIERLVMTAQDTYQINIFSEWRDWFYSISRESGLVEYKEATDIAVENVRAKSVIKNPICFIA